MQQLHAWSNRRYHSICFLSYTILCIAWNIYAGKDENWDLLNYHLYAPHAWWKNRIPDELFAASFQGYLNPLAHLPFYALHSAGLHSLAISSTLAILHSSNLWLLHLISSSLLPPHEDLKNKVLIFCGVLLGGLAPTFLIEVGTSFTDVVTSIPALGATLSLIHWQTGRLEKRADAQWHLFNLSSFLLGASSGLKLTNAVYAVAIIVATLITSRAPATKGLSRAILFGTIGLLLADGPHQWMLWSAFSNPFFPLFNHIFHSPWYESVNLICERFRPETLLAALLYPLHLTDPFRRTGFEIMTSDIRLIWLLGLAPIALIRTRKNLASRHKGTINSRLLLIAVSLALFFPAWLYSSGINRYAMPGFLLIGPITAALAYRLHHKSATLSLLVIALPLSMQTTTTLTLNTARWNPQPWTKTWLEAEVPEQLKKKPYYYLSLQTQTYAALSTLLHPDSRMTNLVGQITLNPSGPIWRKVVESQQRLGLEFRSLQAVGEIGRSGAIPSTRINAQDALLSEYGLKVDQSDCKFIALNQDPSLPPPHWIEKVPDSIIESSPRTILASCGVRAIETVLSPDEKARREAIDIRFKDWEVRCPRSFAPRSSVTENMTNRLRQRSYVNTDTYMVWTPNGLFAGQSIYGDSLIQLEDKNGQRVLPGCFERKIGTNLHPDREETQ